MSRQQLEKLIGIITKQTPLGAQAIEASRQFMDEGGGKFKTPADVTTKAIKIGAMNAEWISTPASDTGKTLLYFHGGGYASGSITSHRYLMQNLARASGCRTLGINYRLAPEHPFPAALEDAKASYQWLLEQGHAPSTIAIGGDSAGGGLAVATLVALRDASVPLPAAALCISPWADLTGTAQSYTTQHEADPMIAPDAIRKVARWYHASTPADSPLVSPVFAKLSGLPPLLIQVGEREVLQDDATTLANNARQAGVDVTLEVAPGMIHVWHAYAPMLEEGQTAVERAGLFLKKQLLGKSQVQAP